MPIRIRSEATGDARRFRRVLRVRARAVDADLMARLKGVEPRAVRDDHEVADLEIGRFHEVPAQTCTAVSDQRTEAHAPDLDASLLDANGCRRPFDTWPPVDVQCNGGRT